MNHKNIIFWFLCISFIGLEFHSTAQTQQEGAQLNVNDSLTLPQILKQVLGSYPSIARAQEAIQAAEGGIGLAKAGYYPNISADAGYTRIGPVPELTIPNLGHFVMAPNDNYDASITVHENIYDFDKTKTKCSIRTIEQGTISEEC